MSVPLQELESWYKSLYRILEICSVTMCAIGVIGTMLGDDFDEIMMKVKEENKALVKE